MNDNEIKIFKQGRERETIRGLTLSQMYVISAILKRCGVSHKTFTYRDGQLASVDWVEAPDLRAALEALFTVIASVDTVYEGETGRTIEQDFAEELDKAREALG